MGDVRSTLSEDTHRNLRRLQLDLEEQRGEQVDIPDAVAHAIERGLASEGYDG